MKLGRIIIAGLFLVGSTSASAGALIDMISIHNIDTLKLKGAEVDDNKIKTFSINDKDVAEALVGRELTKDEKLSAFVPCPVGDFLAYGGFYLGVWDSELREVVGTLVDFEVFNPIVAVKDLEITDVAAPMDGNITAGAFDVNIYASAQADAAEVKNLKTEPGLNGKNCVKKLKTKSVMGYDDSGADDFVIESGKIKAGKVVDGGTVTEIFPAM